MSLIGKIMKAYGVLAVVRVLKRDTALVLSLPIVAMEVAKRATDKTGLWLMDYWEYDAEDVRGTYLEIGITGTHMDWGAAGNKIGRIRVVDVLGEWYHVGYLSHEVRRGVLDLLSRTRVKLHHASHTYNETANTYWLKFANVRRWRDHGYRLLPIARAEKCQERVWSKLLGLIGK